MILKDLVRFIGLLAGNYFVGLCRGFYGFFFKLWSSCISFSSSAIASMGFDSEFGFGWIIYSFYFLFQNCFSYIEGFSGIYLNLEFDQIGYWWFSWIRYIECIGFLLSCLSLKKDQIKTTCFYWSSLIMDLLCKLYNILLIWKCSGVSSWYYWWLSC